MSSYNNASEITLIDYEYGMWNPAHYDLGTYLNEMVVDNAHPYGQGVAYYPENWATEEDIERITMHYWILSK